MSVSARLATLLVLAVHLAVASAAPCFSRSPAEPGRHADALAARGPAPHCPGHHDADEAPSTWLDALCPCGCQTGAPPGHDGSRTVPALLLAGIAGRLPTDRPVGVAPPTHVARVAPASPDHVPLATA